jgi:hypothetical protein
VWGSLGRRGSCPKSWLARMAYTKDRRQRKHTTRCVFLSLSLSLSNTFQTKLHNKKKVNPPPPPPHPSTHTQHSVSLLQCYTFVFLSIFVFYHLCKGRDGCQKRVELAGDCGLRWSFSMTEVYRRMLSDEDDDSPEKCRERRRRRIEMRRLAVISAASSPPLTPSQNQNEIRSDCSVEAKRIRRAENTDFPAAAASSSPSSSGDDIETSSEPEKNPVFGTMSVSGRSREMEDAIAVRTRLCRPEISGRRSVHFFAVFDGHGGPHV